MNVSQIASVLAIFSFVAKFYKNNLRKHFNQSDIEELQEYIDTEKERKKIAEIILNLPYMKEFLDEGDELHSFISSAIISFLIIMVLQIYISIFISVIVGMVLGYYFSNKTDMKEIHYGIGGSVVGILVGGVFIGWI